MLNEEVSRDVKDEIAKPLLRFMVQKIGKIVEKDLIGALKKAAQEHSNRQNDLHGEMSVKDLLKKDQGAQSVDIDAMGLGDFKKLANKYGVDFAIVKSTELDPPKYSVFFKARDADAINAVVNEYTAKQLKIAKEGKVSILAKLDKFKDIVAALPKKVAEKRKEQER